MPSTSNPQKPSASEGTLASIENNVGAFEKDHHTGQRDTSDLVDDADDDKRSAPHANAGLTITVWGERVIEYSQHVTKRAEP